MTLARATVGAVTRQAAATLTTNVLFIGQYVILGRLLAPGDFGIMTMATVVSGYASLAADAGLGSATIQSRDEDPVAWSTLFWLNLALAVAVTVVVVLASPLVALAYGEPRVTLVLAVTSLVFPLTALGQQHQALAERALRFDITTRAEVLATVVGVSAAIAGAFAGLGAFALVASVLATALVRTTVLMTSPELAWRPTWVLDVGRVRAQLRFGGHLLGQRTFNYLTANLDFLLIGRALGSDALGFYAVAYNLANVPATRLNQVVGRVFFPVFARIQDDVPKLRANYLRLVDTAGMVTAPTLAAVAAAAPVALPALLGERWGPSVPLLQVLCFVGTTRAIAGTIGPLLLARGRSDLGFTWSLLAMAVQAPLLWVGLRYGGAVGVALGFAAAQVVLVVWTYRMLVRALVGRCGRTFFGHLFDAVVLAVMTGAPVWLVSRTIAMPPSTLTVMGVAALAAGCGAAAVSLWKRRELAALIALVTERPPPDSTA